MNKLKLNLPKGTTKTKIVKICVKNGDSIDVGSKIVEIEGQKGNISIKSNQKGIVEHILINVGDIVEDGVEILELSSNKVESIKSNTTGTIQKIFFKNGDLIQAGDVLMNIEANKGAKAIKSTVSGQIVEVLIREGDKVNLNDDLINIDTTIKVDIKEETDDNHSDVLVIGGGPGGYVAAIYAAQHGKSVTLIEKNKLGGTCLNVGCIPTKALVKSSEVFDEIIHSEQFGIQVSSVKADILSIMNHKEKVVNNLVEGIGFLMNKNNVKVIYGDAKFLDKNSVAVNDITLTATDIIIATGSKISKINIPGIDLPHVMNSTDALSAKELPQSIVIIGGGVIGMEFAFIYKNLGVDVTVVEFMDRLLTMVDYEASEEILRIAKNKGIKVHLSSKVTLIEENQVTYEHDNIQHTLQCDKVLVAIGREPQLDGLDIEKVGCTLARKGIEVNNKMQTNIEHIYAIGDVTNIIQLAHVASEQGIIAVDNILGHNKTMDYTAVPNVVFTDPEIACVGVMEQDVKGSYKSAKFYFASNGKAQTMHKEDGFVKVIQDEKTKQIIGATIIGPDASSLISTMTLAVQNKMKAEDIEKTIFAHPTTSEAIHEAVLGLGLGSIHQ